MLGSACMILVLLSMYESFLKGPPTTAPTATFGFGASEFSHSKPLQPVLASFGMDAPLWCTCVGYLLPYPIR